MKNDICKKCGGYITPPKTWMCVIPPKMCEKYWAFNRKGCE